MAAGFAHDIIVVRRDGTLRSFGWNVHFNNRKCVENGSEENVTISIDGRKIKKYSLSVDQLNSKDKKGMPIFTPTSEVLKNMKLQYGKNKITFTRAQRQGAPAQEVEGYIFLWNSNVSIVVTDVDGTITMSDILGHLMHIVRKDWTRAGVASLFSKIKENDYVFLYLSGRPTYMVDTTHNLISRVNQDGEPLPDGPVIISTEGLGHAILREGLGTQGEDFKVPVLQKIQKLFPSAYCPFYAGFGNRESDRKSYQALKIPCTKIFHYTEKGEIAVECNGKRSATYSDNDGFSHFVKEKFPARPSAGISVGARLNMFNKQNH